MKKIFTIATFIIISINFAFAVPARPGVMTIVQKNGTEISIKLNGDENFHFQTTEDGILITENSDGIFEYAKMSKDGAISATGVLAKNKNARSQAETSFIQTLNNEKVSEIATNIRAERAEQNALFMKSAAPAATNAIGERGIVILVNFSDKAFVTPDPNYSFCNLLNQTGYSQNHAIGSARDYFTECSNGAFQPNFDVYGPYTLPQTLNYYGQNDANGNDLHAVQMIIDACTAAYNAGVDFSRYDTDGDGYVDNVFVFYAGYGEASGAPANTIWPHRFVVSSKPKFGTVKIYDYACSSELKGKTGSTMDGIGTFCHEFSHVLGLPDLYNTDNSSAVNLEQWDIMDAGCYNGPGNGGDIPAMYSSYERFYVGWLVPQIINACSDYSLPPLENANPQAYLISKTATHNLNGKNPNPTEFYMLENRQKTSYDSYLPGSGLLVTRITYYSPNWNSNTVNNTTPKGVEIIKAGSTQASWAFPSGSTNSFSAQSSTGTEWGKYVTLIQKSGQNMTFHFEQTNCPSSIPPPPQNKSVLRSRENSEAITCLPTAVTEPNDNPLTVINYPLNWYISMDYGKYSAEIYTINGMLLKTFYFESEASISKNDIPDGIYLLKIKDLDNNKTYFSKVIK